MSEIKPDIEFSEACAEIAQTIISNECAHIEEDAMIIMKFIEALDEGETNRMSVALARQKDY